MIAPARLPFGDTLLPFVCRPAEPAGHLQGLTSSVMTALEGRTAFCRPDPHLTRPASRWSSSRPPTFSRCSEPGTWPSSDSGNDVMSNCVSASVCVRSLGKYNMIFFVPAVAISILWFPEWRNRADRPILGNGGTCRSRHASDPLLEQPERMGIVQVPVRPRLPAVARGISPTWGFSAVSSARSARWCSPVLVDGVEGRSRRRAAQGTGAVGAALALPMMLFSSARGLTSKVEANWPQIAYLVSCR